QALVDSGQVPESAGVELSRLPDKPSQFELAHAIAAGRMSRDQVAEAVRARGGKRTVRPRPSRLALRLGGGVCITLSSGEPLSWDALLSAVDHFRREAKDLHRSGGGVADLARKLRA